jgi:tRNA pseudouridine13 synthase
MTQAVGWLGDATDETDHFCSLVDWSMSDRAVPRLSKWTVRPTLPPMQARSTAELPGVEARCGRKDRICTEILARQPGATGDYYWLKVEKTDLSTGQVRSAIARSVSADESLVGCAGNRDRQGRCIQWFSIPIAVVDHPGPLRRAGVAGKMRVLEMTSSHKPVVAETVSRLLWSCTLRKGRVNDGYLRAKAVMDRLRQVGIPNYVPLHPNDDGTDARWGRDLLQGKRLPKGIIERIGRGRCLRAIQEALFNHYLSSRVSDGLLDQVVTGDILRDSNDLDSVVTDVVHAKKRIASWESVVCGPMFGKGMMSATAEAAERELATLGDADIPIDQVSILHGERRPLRVQPAKSLVDLQGDDLVVSCELPCETAITVFLNEVLKPAMDQA